MSEDTKQLHLNDIQSELNIIDKELEVEELFRTISQHKKRKIDVIKLLTENNNTILSPQEQMILKSKVEEATLQFIKESGVSQRKKIIDMLNKEIETEVTESSTNEYKIISNESKSKKLNETRKSVV